MLADNRQTGCAILGVEELAGATLSLHLAVPTTSGAIVVTAAFSHFVRVVVAFGGCTCGHNRLDGGRSGSRTRHL